MRRPLLAVGFLLVTVNPSMAETLLLDCLLSAPKPSPLHGYGSSFHVVVDTKTKAVDIMDGWVLHDGGRSADLPNLRQFVTSTPLSITFGAENPYKSDPQDYRYSIDRLDGSFILSGSGGTVLKDGTCTPVSAKPKF